MRKRCTIAFAVGLILIACSKEDPVDPAPVIEFQSISDEVVMEFENEIAVTFNYQDANGDLGYQDPDIYALRVKDARLLEYDWYHIPPITPEQEELQVEGSFTVYLNSLFLLGNAEQEITTFSIQVKDRAGNWSNQIITPEVLIVDSL